MKAGMASGIPAEALCRSVFGGSPAPATVHVGVDR